MFLWILFSAGKIDPYWKIDMISGYGFIGFIKWVFSDIFAGLAYLYRGKVYLEFGNQWLGGKVWINKVRGAFIGRTFGDTFSVKAKSIWLVRLLFGHFHLEVYR